MLVVETPARPDNGDPLPGGSGELGICYKVEEVTEFFNIVTLALLFLLFR